MAANFIPLIIAAGAVGYLATKDTKKKDKDANCPPLTKITVGEMQSVAARAEEKFGKIEDPSEEANFFVRQLLPEGCNRASKDSKFQLEIAESGKSWEIDIPSAYIMTFGSALGARFQKGAVTKDQGDKFWARELDWYKSVTGKNFDIEALGLSDLAKDIGESMLASLSEMGFGSMVGGPKGAPDSSELPAPGKCPSNFEWIFDSEEDERLKAAFNQGRQLFPNDAMKIGDVMFQSVVFPGCTKRDFDSTVTMVLAMGGEPQPVNKIDLAAFYAMMVLEAANMMGLSPAQNVMLEDQVASDYQALTGRPLQF